MEVSKITISFYEKIEIANHINRVIIKLIGESSSEVLYKEICEDLENQIKREYGLKTIDEFTDSYLHDLHELLDEYKLPKWLEEMYEHYKMLMH